jgi:ADP-L-glycero-D-manno-heptose 6-epimerase
MTGAVLVTGSAGFIGSHLAAACCAAGWPVTAVDRRSAGPGTGTRTEEIRADAADPSILARVRRGEFAAVLHQAAVSDTLEERWDVLEEANVAVPLALARACAASGSRFIYASSGSVYGAIRSRVPVPEHAAGDPRWCSGPRNLYAKSKLLLERRIGELGGDLPWVGLRYTNVFGTGEEHKGRMASIISQLLRRAAHGQRIELFSDTLLAARDYLPVAALAGTVLELLRQPVPAGAYNLGAGHAISFAELLGWCAGLRSDGRIELRLTPNPIPGRYQYWTCADMTALHAVLPGTPRVTAGDVRLAAAGLFRSFAAARPA